jgi:hypothetical protein
MVAGREGEEREKVEKRRWKIVLSIPFPVV